MFAIALAIGLACAARPLRALDPQKSLTQFSHRSWGVSDGIAGVTDVTQTADGYLWIAAKNGVFKFDGLVFSRWEPPAGGPQLSSDILRVLGSRDGSLWITSEDKVFRLKGDHLTIYGPDNGLAGNRVVTLFEAKDGAIWAGSQEGISRFVDEKWRKMGTEDGLPEGCMTAACMGKNGNVWMCVGSPTRSPPCEMAALGPGEQHFQAMPEKTGVVVDMCEAPDGKIWVAETSRSVRAFLPDRTKLEFVRPEIRVGSNSILFDRDGTLWIATQGDGLRRISDTAALEGDDIPRSSDAIDKYTRNDGLSSNFVHHIFEDREGNIWLGTSAGLDCLRENKITALSVREGLPFDNNLLVQATSDGSVWIGATPDGFAKLSKGQTHFVNRRWLDLKPSGLVFTSVGSLYESPVGDLLLGTGFGPVVVRNDTAEYLKNSVASQIKDIRSMTYDAGGMLWINSRSQGFLGLSGTDGENLWEIEGVDRAVGKVVNVCSTDHSGRVWVGFEKGGLVSYEPGTRARHKFTAENGLLPGSIRAIVSDAKDALWVAGFGGLSRFKDGRFQTLNAQNGLPEDDLSSLLIDDEGNFWMGGSAGIFHVRASELDRVLNAGTGQVQGDFFDSQDGLRGFLSVRNDDLRVSPLASKSTDGRLWFSSNEGLAVIDPKHIPTNPLPPPVRIEKIVAAGQSHPAAADLKFPPGTRDCEIHYVGLSFVNPSRVRYKYQLEGYDSTWVEAGTRREAFYSNLRPRSYRFRVMACNNDGVWNEAGDTLAFSVAPTFYETPWCPVLFAFPVALGIWGLYRLRLARITAGMNQQLQGQIKERKRIAQELHDTLLQGFTGVGLKLDAITNQLPDSLQATKEQLRKILEQSDQYLTEARRSVWALRSTSLEESGDFARALSEASERILAGTGIEFIFAVDGVQRSLGPVAEDNLLRICQEAVTNAVKHARPSRVGVSLEFSPSEVRLRVQDNGCGFEPGGVGPGQVGHFGLAGIHERAEAMGGTLALQTDKSGTEIVATVYAAR